MSSIMSRLVAVLVVVLCAVLLPCAVHAMPVVANLKKTLGQDSWDYFMFVEQYPAGVCYYQGSDDCYYPSNATHWTMHGIWPTAKGTKGPNYCQPNAAFELDVIESLIPRLVAEWTNLMPSTTLDSFWAHEWTKHGTCATGINSLGTEYGFFSTVLDLFEKEMNFWPVIENHGITPSHSATYQLADFNQAFMDKLGVKPFVECLYSEEKGQVLSQISVCLQKDFSMMECPEDVFTRAGCWDSQPIHYIPSRYSSN